MASLGVAAIAVAGVVWLSAQSRVVPYVVGVNYLGDALAVRRAHVVTSVDPAVIRAQLARFIGDVRSVSTCRPNAPSSARPMRWWTRTPPPSPS